MKQRRHKGPTRTNDLAAKRLYHLAHCNMRLRHRYGFEMEPEEYDALCEAFASRKVVGARDDGIGHVEGWVKLRDQWICASYKKADKLVGTIMPAPPPLILDEVSKQAAERSKRPPEPSPAQSDPEHSREVANASKKMALQLLRLSMESGKMPKWLKPLAPELEPKPAEPPPAPQVHVASEVKMQDIRWFKGKIADACKLMREGRILDAMLLVDAVGSLPRTFHPGKDVDAADREIQKRIDSNRFYYENLLNLMGCAHRFYVPPKEAA